MCLSRDALHFSPTNIHATLCQTIKFFSPPNVIETDYFSTGLGSTFFCLPQRFSPFHENFRIKEFDMLRFFSQKIVNLSGTQCSSFYPESGLLPLAPDTPPFLIKKPHKNSKKLNFLKKTVHNNKQTYHKVFNIFSNPKNHE